MTILGPGDVVFTPRRLGIRGSVAEPERISFTHRVDNVSQEIDETYTLTINIESGSFGGDDELITEMAVTIIDSDGEFMQRRGAYAA